MLLVSTQNPGQFGKITLKRLYKQLKVKDIACRSASAQIVIDRTLLAYKAMLWLLNFFRLLTNAFAPPFALRATVAGAESHHLAI